MNSSASAWHRPTPIRPVAFVARVLLAGSFCWAGASAHAGSYQVVDLGGTTNGVDTRVYGLNQRGVAVGQAGGRAAPHLAHPVKSAPDGHRVDLAARDGMPDVRGSAVAINDRGQTTGWIETAFGQDVVAFIERQGTLTLFPAPSGAVPTVRAINARGDVVGDVWAIEDACVGTCAFLIHDGLWTTLPALPRGQLSYARAINADGLIVGQSFQGSDRERPIKAVAWREGRVQVLPGMEHLFASAYDVNDRGDVVGEFQPPGSPLQHAFMWRDGSIADLDDRADSASNAWAVNASGQAIGDRSLPSRHGFFVTGDDGMQWLDDQLLPGPDGPWTLGDVRDINDAGQIVGTAKDARGQWHAVRLDPRR